MAKKKFIPNKLNPWIEARKRFGLSHAQVQMARELGMNPKKLGSLANHRQQPWKVPLPRYIELCYEKQFGRAKPLDVRPLEVKDAQQRARKKSRRAAREAATSGNGGSGSGAGTGPADASTGASRDDVGG